MESLCEINEGYKVWRDSNNIAPETISVVIVLTTVTFHFLTPKLIGHTYPWPMGSQYIKFHEDRWTVKQFYSKNNFLISLCCYLDLWTPKSIEYIQVMGGGVLCGKFHADRYKGKTVMLGKRFSGIVVLWPWTLHGVHDPRFVCLFVALH